MQRTRPAADHSVEASVNEAPLTQLCCLLSRVMTMRERTFDHDNQPCLLRRGAVLLMALCSMALLALLGGCSNTPSKPKADLCPGVVRVSNSGASLFSAAQQRYAQIRLMDLQGKRLESELSEVMKLLDGAITNDRRAAIFHSKMGDIRLEAGQVGQAEGYYNRSRELCQEWVPAWIGLAKVATQRGDLAGADSYLNSAAQAMAKLERGAEPKAKQQPNFFLAALGVNLPATPEPKKDPNDPTYEEDEKLRILVSWLQANEAWVVENGGLVSPTGELKVVKTGDLFRRLKATIAFQRVLMTLAEGAEPQAVLTGLDYVLQWDPNYFPARIEQAVQLRKLNNFKDAERLLLPMVANPANPVLSNSAKLNYEMAAIYTDWFKQTKEARTADAADQFFSKLHTLNGEHVDGYIKRADLYLAAGTEFKRDETLVAGLTCLDHARNNLGRETPEIASLRTQLQQARQKIAG